MPGNSDRANCMKRIYVAGPMHTSGRPAENLRRACILASSIMDMGHAPFVPHLHWLSDAITPQSESTWLDCDFAFLRAVDAVYRLPGESRGADLEIEEAHRLGLPVLRTGNELYKFLKHGELPEGNSE